MITNQIAVDYSNGEVRQIADLLIRLSNADAVQLLIARIASAETAWADVSNLFPDDANEIVNDGSDHDGRTPISGADVQRWGEVITAFNNFHQVFTANRDAILKIEVNG